MNLLKHKYLLALAAVLSISFLYTKPAQAQPQCVEIGLGTSVFKLADCAEIADRIDPEQLCPEAVCIRWCSVDPGTGAETCTNAVLAQNAPCAEVADSCTNANTFEPHSFEVYVSGDKSGGNALRLKDIHPREIEARTSVDLGDGLFLSINSWGSAPIQTQPSPFEAHGQAPGGDDGGPSTPYLFTYNGDNYYIENDVMNTYRNQYYEIAKKQYESGTGDQFSFGESDHYKLRLNPTVTEDGIKLMIKELEPEESHLDQIELVRVVHPNNSTLILNHIDKEILTVLEKPLKLTKSCTLSNGNSCLKEIKTMDDQFVEGFPPQEIEVTYDVSSLKLKDLAEIAEKELTVTLKWTSHHLIDHIGLVNVTEVKNQSENLELLAATHSKDQDVKDVLSHKDLKYAHTVKGDEISLVFEKPSINMGKGNQESYVFISRGFYHGLRTYLYPSVDTSQKYRQDIENYVDELEALLKQKIQSGN